MCAGYDRGMQRPVPREQVQLSPAEAHEFEDLTAVFERVEEHLLSWSLVPRIRD